MNWSPLQFQRATGAVETAGPMEIGGIARLRRLLLDDFHRPLEHLRRPHSSHSPDDESIILSQLEITKHNFYVTPPTQLPKELARRESRLKKIRQARAELEAEARQKAAQAKADAEARMAQRRKQEERTGKKTGGGQPRVPDPKQAAPDAKAQRNFTDPDSRIMPDGAHKGSFVQAYNAQIAVDDDTQVIVAAEIT